jgi:hypothetical protein
MIRNAVLDDRRLEEVEARQRADAISSTASSAEEVLATLGA